MHNKYIAIADEDDNVIGKATWKEAHEKGMITRAANVLVFNSKGELLVHKRSRSLPTFPGMHDIKLGGVVDDGEGYEETALRELKEEAGIENAKLKFLFYFKYRSDEYKNNRKVYSCIYNGKVRLQEEEIEEGKFVTLDEAKKLVAGSDVSPSAAEVFWEFLKRNE